MRARWMFFVCLAVPGALAATGRTARLAEPRGVVADARPTFVWTAVESASRYELRVLDETGAQLTESVLPTQCVGGECAIPSPRDLAFGKYRWYVVTEIVGRRNRSSGIRRFTVSPDPSRPSKVELTAPLGELDTTTPTFRWKAVSQARFYELFIRGGKPRTLFREIYAEADVCATGTCTAAPSLTHLDLGDGRYVWWVRASNFIGNGPRSKRLRFDVRTLPRPPGRPVPLWPRGRLPDTSPRFVWTVAERATDYHLQVRRGREEILSQWFPADPKLCDAETCAITPPGLVLEHGRYQFRVTAKNAAGEGRPSRRRRFRIGDFLGTPTLIAPEGPVGPMPTFEWTAVPDATHYYLLVKSRGRRVGLSRYEAADVCAAATCSTTLDHPLEPGLYKWWVGARSDTRKRGNTSLPLTFEVSDSGGTPPGIPELLAPVGVVTTATPTYKWNPVPTATAYTLVVKDSTNPVLIEMTFSSADAQCAAECSVTPAEALKDGKYAFYVTALAGSVKGAPSPEGAFEVDTTGATPPPKAIGMAPVGRIATANPAFVWSFVTEAASYTLTVDDGSQAPRFQQTLTPAEAGCTATECTAAPALDLADGDYTFRVDTTSAGGLTTLGDLVLFTVATSGGAELRILSPAEGDTVLDTGVLISGTAGPATASLTVQLDIDGQTVMPPRPVDIAPDGTWSVFLLGNQLSPGAAVVRFVATDSGGAMSTTLLNLTVIASDVKGTMLLSRATFGATPALLDEVRRDGAAAFQDRLLDPVPDPDFDAFVATLPTSSADDVREWALMHMLFNPNPLQEVLTQFWDNHFSTDMGKHDVPAYELAENRAFRANAFGRFRDLLEISAKSPAMLIYLDLTESTAAEPNENYPRELLELHTLSVDGPYDQGDVEALARILTGWKEVGGQFFFDANDHDTGEKFFLGQRFAPGGGLDEGERVLDMLADHPSTARFLCTKLAQLFVSETPRTGLIDGCETVFLAEHRNGNPNQIREVVRFLLDSPDFVDPANFRAKVKTPLELLTGVVRNLGATVENPGNLERELRSLGMNLFHNHPPDGFPELADDWVDTGLLLDRVNFVNEVARNTGTQGTFVDIRQYFLDRGLDTAEGIASYLSDIAFQNELTSLELAIALDILNGGGTSPFEINAGDAGARLRRLVATLFSFPGYQHQ